MWQRRSARQRSPILVRQVHDSPNCQWARRRAWLDCIRCQKPSLSPKKRQRRRSERFQTVAWRYWEIVETTCSIKDGELTEGNASKASETPHLSALEESTGVAASKRPDHLFFIPPLDVPTLCIGIQLRRPQGFSEAVQHMLQQAGTRVRPQRSVACSHRSPA